MPYTDFCIVVRNAQIAARGKDDVVDSAFDKPVGRIVLLVVGIEAERPAIVDPEIEIQAGVAQLGPQHRERRFARPAVGPDLAVGIR